MNQTRIAFCRSGAFRCWGRLIDAASGCRRVLETVTVVCLIQGCVWHGRSSDIIYGPAFIRSDSAENHARVQQIQLPVLFEGGRQWGMTLGFASRTAMASVQESNSVPAVEETLQNGFHWLFTRIQYHHPPELIRRAFAGIQFQIGREATALSAGYGSKISFSPRTDGVFLVRFNSANLQGSQLLYHPTTVPVIATNPATDPLQN